MVGDDRQSLESGLRQPLLLDHFAPQEETQIVSCSQRPFAGDLNDIDATIGIVALQIGEKSIDVRAFRQKRGKLRRR